MPPLDFAKMSKLTFETPDLEKFPCLELAYKALKAQYQERVWSAVIPIDTKFRDASLAQTPPPVFAPKSRGVFAYNTLLTYLLQLAPEN